jgi:D-glycero-alpha-D-manno-heptose 1-phosphate guanylyltransferase
LEALTAVVLAGGAGTRLRALVPDVPKPLAPVGGRPFLAYLLDRLAAGGIRRIVLAVGHGAERIAQAFGDEYAGARLVYSVETEPLGTGGALLRSLEQVPSATALVLNGDTLLDLDYRALFAWYAEEPEALAMVLRAVDDAGRYGSVVLREGRVTGFVEKGTQGPGLINAGIYMVPRGLLARYGLSGAFSLERDFLQRHCASLAPRAFVSDGYFLDIGTPEDYERAQRELPPAGG